MGCRAIGQWLEWEAATDSGADSSALGEMLVSAPETFRCTKLAGDISCEGLLRGRTFLVEGGTRVDLPHRVVVPNCHGHKFCTVNVVLCA